MNPDAVDHGADEVHGLRADGLVGSVAVRAVSGVAAGPVLFAVTGQEAATLAQALVLELGAQVVGIGADDGDVKVDEVGVVQGVALDGVDAVRVVAGRTGRVFALDVLAVLGEALVGQDAAAIVARRSSELGG